MTHQVCKSRLSQGDNSSRSRLFQILGYGRSQFENGVSSYSTSGPNTLILGKFTKENRK